MQLSSSRADFSDMPVRNPDDEIGLESFSGHQETSMFCRNGTSVYSDRRSQLARAFLREEENGRNHSDKLRDSMWNCFSCFHQRDARAPCEEENVRGRVQQPQYAHARRQAFCSHFRLSILPHWALYAGRLLQGLRGISTFANAYRIDRVCGLGVDSRQPCISSLGVSSG